MRNKIQYVKGTCKYILSPKYSSNLCRLRELLLYFNLLYIVKKEFRMDRIQDVLYILIICRGSSYHNISYIFIYKIRVFLFIWTESPLSSPMRFNHRISVWSLEGENDTAAGVRGVFELGWPPDETKRPYKNFLLRKATHESEREGSEKKNILRLVGQTFDEVRLVNSVQKRDSLYISASRNVRWTVTFQFPADKNRFPVAFLKNTVVLVILRSAACH